MKEVYYSHRGFGYVHRHQIHKGLCLRTTILNGSATRKTGELVGPEAHAAYEKDLNGAANAVEMKPKK